ncbi:MAG: ABC transporter ATP-binding protein [Chloroflexota bacterium]|nr:ABC transporter ATP-binding protein [Chloroflexota bacterium]
MASIRLRSLSKHFGPVVAVSNLDLELPEGELIAFLGPSGCGKTTTLRLIAGFETADTGEIYLGGKDVTTLPPERRDAGMVFQNYALFPHMTVFENVAFGLQMRKEPKEVIAKRVYAILDKVQLTGLDRRYPRQLSGGQQQRTALARALVFNPTVLLLDEPLANLDAKLREEMRFYIRHLQQEFAITTIYVTHDQAEALVLADRVAVMRDGVLQQIGRPEEIYRRPRNAWVADFVGVANLVPGTVTERADGIVTVATIVGCLRGAARAEAATGAEVFVSVRPESLRLAAADAGLPVAAAGDPIGAGPENRLTGVVEERSYLGNLVDYRVRVAPDLVLRVQAAPSSVHDVADRVALSCPVEQTWIVLAEGEGADGGDGAPHPLA